MSRLPGWLSVQHPFAPPPSWTRGRSPARQPIRALSSRSVLRPKQQSPPLLSFSLPACCNCSQGSVSSAPGTTWDQHREGSIVLDTQPCSRIPSARAIRILNAFWMHLLCNPYTVMGYILLSLFFLYFIFWWGKWDSEKLHSLVKVGHLLSREARVGVGPASEPLCPPWARMRKRGLGLRAGQQVCACILSVMWHCSLWRIAGIFRGCPLKWPSYTSFSLFCFVLFWLQVRLVRGANWVSSWFS